MASCGWAPATASRARHPQNPSSLGGKVLRVDAGGVVVWLSHHRTVGGDVPQRPAVARWDGALAVAVLKGSQLRIMKLNAAGSTVVDQVVTLTDQVRLRTALQDPDGALYVTTSNGANDEILRVTRS